ncbi:MAG: acetyl-CoA carboxylase biotin carboxyl carrier protein subunit [Bacteroidia bacterium]|jgi:biotin carboxyl carrier protein
MLQVKTTAEKTYTVEFKGERFWVDGQAMESDLIRLSANKYHALIGHRSVTLELISRNEADKTIELMVNGIKQTLEVKDQYDLLLKALNLDKLTETKQNDIKAPMPGMVLRIMVAAGDSVKKGDPLLVLEAMKMENIIKSHADAVVQKVCIEEKTAVEKGQVLINLS